MDRITVEQIDFKGFTIDGIMFAPKSHFSDPISWIGNFFQRVTQLDSKYFQLFAACKFHPEVWALLVNKMHEGNYTVEKVIEWLRYVESNKPMNLDEYSDVQSDLDDRKN